MIKDRKRALALPKIKVMLELMSVEQTRSMLHDGEPCNSTLLFKGKISSIEKNDFRFYFTRNIQPFEIEATYASYKNIFTDPITEPKLIEIDKVFDTHKKVVIHNNLYNIERKLDVINKLIRRLNKHPKVKNSPYTYSSF